MECHPIPQAQLREPPNRYRYNRSRFPARKYSGIDVAPEYRKSRAQIPGMAK